jgi:hypothetical protein
MSADNGNLKRDRPLKKTVTKSRTISVKKARRGEGGISVARIMRNTRYRSQFEINLARALAERKIIFEYEQAKLEYIPKPRTYTPDFYLPEQNIYIEAKGHLDKGDRVKMQLIKQQYPDLDIRFVFVRATNKIYKGSKTSYADWANRYGFQWAEGSVPEEWLKND